MNIIVYNLCLYFRVLEFLLTYLILYKYVHQFDVEVHSCNYLELLV